ncbi:MAG: hypothetical protein AAGC67_21525 [Myxococcota bacterium]
MNESERSNQFSPVAVAAVDATAVGVAPSAQSPESVRGMDPADRPAASGHRFGPDLACSECGIQWDAHQRAPAPCGKDDASEVFLRRPAIEG